MRPNVDRSGLFIMRILYEADSGLQPYTLLKRSKLSGEVFFRKFSELVLKGLLVEKNSLIFLSPAGSAVLITSGNKVSAAPKEWRQVPKNMLGRKVEVGDFYTPNIFLLKS